MLLALFSLSLLEAWWDFSTISFEGPEGGVGVALFGYAVFFTPTVSEAFCFVYQRLRSRLYTSGNLKEALLLCWLIAPAISVLVFLAYFGGFFAMGLISLFLWRDWKEWGQTGEKSRQAEKCDTTLKPGAGGALEPNVQFCLLMAALALPFPGLWWLLEHGGFEFISLEIGGAILVLNLYFVPFIAQLIFAQYQRTCKELYRTKDLRNVLIRFGACAPLHALLAMVAYLGGLLAMGMVGWFLWRDRKECLRTGREPAGNILWEPNAKYGIGVPFKANHRILILVGIFLFPIPWVEAIGWRNDLEDGLFFALMTLPSFPVVGRLCWAAYLQLLGALKQGKLPQEILPLYLLYLIGIPVVLSVLFRLCLPNAGLSIGVGSFSVMLAIGYFLWQDEKELQKTKSEPLSTDG